MSVAIDTKLELSARVSRYLDSADTYNRAERDFEAACEMVSHIARSLQTNRMVLTIRHQTYLFEVQDVDGSFTVEPIEAL